MKVAWSAGVDRTALELGVGDWWAATGGLSNFGEMPMDPFFTEDVQAWFELILLWIGFGTCVGLLAKAIMPGRDPGGAVATLLMGITGVVIGCGVYSLIYDERLSPISSVGLVCGTLGAFVILLFYRLLGGFLLSEPREASDVGRAGVWRMAGPPSMRRRRRYSHFLEE